MSWSGRATAAGARHDRAFDLTVDHIEAAHRDYAAKGLSPSEIRRGRFHDSFEVAGPGGWTFTINSSHVSGKPI